MALIEKKEALKLLSLLLAYLIILIPIASTYSFAAITSIKVSGGAGFEGYRGKDDSTVVKVILPGAPAASDVLINNFYPFGGCTIYGSNSECTYTYSGKNKVFPDTPLVAGSGATPFSVRYKSETGSSQIFVDESAPAFKLFNFSQEMSSLTATYDISEKACGKPECESICSGLSKITVTANGKNVYIKDVKGKPDVDCKAAETIELNLTGVYGNQNMCINAFDNAGNKGSNCTEIYVDLSGPEISNVQVTDRQRNPITLIKQRPNSPLIVSAVFTDPNIDATTIFADISKLTGNKQDNAVKPANNRCFNVTYTEDSVRCDWNIVFVIRNTDESPSIVFYGTDKFGNAFNYSVPLSGVAFDLEGPVIESIKTYGTDGRIHCDNNNCFVNKEGTNRIKVTLKDGSGTGGNKKASGLSKRNIFLDLSQLNSKYSGGGKGTQVTNCSCDASETYKSCSCYFDAEIDPSGTEEENRVRISVLKTSADDSGNPINEKSSNLTALFVYDATPPSIDNVILPQECPTTDYDREYGNYIINVSATDKLASALILFANISNFVADERNGVAPGTCALTDAATGIFECTIPVNPNKLITMYKKDVLSIVAEDVAGNPFSHDLYDFEVCNSTSDVSNLFSLQPDSAAVTFARRLAANNEFTIRVPFTIATSDNLGCEPKIYYADDDDCWEMGANVSTDTDSTRLVYLNRDENPVSGMLAVKLDMQDSFADNPALDKTTLRCNISFIVRCGDKVYAKKEVERLVKDVSFTGIGPGYPDEGFEDEANKTIDRLKSINNDYRTWRELDGTLRLLCNIASIIVWLDVTVQYARVVTQAILCGITLVFPATAAAIYPVWATTCSITENTLAIINNFVWTPGCGFIGPHCISAALVGNIFRTVCSIYHCQLCGFGNFLQTSIRLAGKGNNLEGKGVVLQYDPYKSKNMAYWCVCLPGALFALEKERQVLCKYYKCLQSVKASGYPHQICNTVKDRDMCLYVEGASWRLSSSAIANLGRTLFNFALGMVAIYFASWGLFSACPNAYIPANIAGIPATCALFNNPCGPVSWKRTICALAISNLAILDLGVMPNSPFNFANIRNQMTQPDEAVDWCEDIPEAGGSSDSIFD